MIVHRVSEERLYHYNCGYCGQWWSIGDRRMKTGTCPHCGHYGKIEPVEDRE